MCWQSMGFQIDSSVIWHLTLNNVEWISSPIDQLVHQIFFLCDCKVWRQFEVSENIRLCHKFHLWQHNGQVYVCSVTQIQQFWRGTSPKKVGSSQPLCRHRSVKVHMLPHQPYLEAPSGWNLGLTDSPSFRPSESFRNPSRCRSFHWTGCDWCWCRGGLETARPYMFG